MKGLAAALAGAALAVSAAAGAQEQGGYAGHEKPTPKERPGHQMGRMQGGSPPEDARDPHAYSDGHTLTQGPYALPGPRQLRLADERSFLAVRGDRLEFAPDGVTLYELGGWFGSTYNRFVLESEGRLEHSHPEEVETRLLWSRALGPYSNLRAGLRIDHDHAAERRWLALGFRSLLPYWVEMDLHAYLAEDGFLALELELEYEWRLNRLLVLQPRLQLHLNAESDPDPAHRLGSGLAEASFGLRLHFNLSRQFAPYLGYERQAHLGQTADLIAMEGDPAHPVNTTRYLAGVRFWF